MDSRAIEPNTGPFFQKRYWQVAIMALGDKNDLIICWISSFIFLLLGFVMPLTFTNHSSSFSYFIVVYSGFIIIFTYFFGLVFPYRRGYLLLDENKIIFREDSIYGFFYMPHVQISWNQIKSIKINNTFIHFSFGPRSYAKCNLAGLGNENITIALEYIRNKMKSMGIRND